MSAQPEKTRAVSKPLLYTLAGVVVLALVGVLVVMPLLAPGEEPLGEATVVVDADATQPPVGATPEEPATDEAGEEALDEELPPIGETFEVFSARDPFQQLVSESTGGEVAVVGGEPTSNDGGTATGGDPGGDSGGAEDADGGDADGDAPPASTSEDGTTVVVEDVFSEDGAARVLLTANGTAYTLGEGETFATNWRVEAIDDPCVTLLYGDQARLVCEGESIRK